MTVLAWRLWFPLNNTKHHEGIQIGNQYYNMQSKHFFYYPPIRNRNLCWNISTVFKSLPTQYFKPSSTHNLRLKYPFCQLCFYRLICLNMHCFKKETYNVCLAITAPKCTAVCVRTEKKEQKESKASMERKKKKRRIRKRNIFLLSPSLYCSENHDCTKTNIPDDSDLKGSVLIMGKINWMMSSLGTPTCVK